ncbi:hypothetical protein BJ878DRAFT_507296 [Calycina marina]|uniref:Uncharacterized protein n=1 Tax=Calycina marina TaxID=1763456 RepID=A0A9P8CEZ1_9HELO|nr:hypothetical protein BJ878DRAFT_507296 [Calycina marina]
MAEAKLEETKIGAVANTNSEEKMSDNTENPAEVKAEDTAGKVKTEETPEVKGEDASGDVKMEDVVKVESPESKNPKTYGAEDGENMEGVLKAGVHVKVDYENHRNNNKFDPTKLPISDNPVEIRNQVEYYFNDSNLRQDTFLLQKTGGAKNNPVPLDVILGFKRMACFQPRSAVISALKESKFLDLEGEDGSEKITRKKPYNPVTAEDHARIIAKSIYVKGFGDEYDVTQVDIENFFRVYQGWQSVKLRRTDEKLFKGSVFVEFADPEDQQAFLALEPKPLWKGKHVLKIQTKEEYTKQKALDIAEGRVKPKASFVAHQRGGRGGRGRGGRGRGGENHRGDRQGRGDKYGRDRRDRDGRNGDRDPDDWKKRRDDDRANGFKDNRGRGGRGRGRDRDERGPRNDRNNDRNKERDNGVKTEDTAAEVKKEAASPENNTPASHKIDTKDVPAATESNEKKRAREEETTEAPPAKKVDIKDA